MKKYWKSIIISLIVVVGIGSLYFQTYIKALSLPEFKIETIEGDEKYIENIVIVGEYTNSENSVDDFGYVNNSNMLYLSKDKTVYRDTLSILSEMKGIPETRDRYLRDEYSSFFRSTNLWLETIFESEDYLVAADIIRSREGFSEGLKVKYLNKETEKTETIFHKMNPNDHLMIDDVQMNENIIYLFTRNWEYHDDGYTKELSRVYQFDITENELVNTEEFGVEAYSDQYASFSTLYDSKSWSPNEYVVYRKTVEYEEAVQEYEEEVQEDEDEFGDGEKVYIREHQLFAYDIESGEMNEIILPDEVADLYVDYYDGSNLYFITENDENVKLAVFNIKENKIVNELEIDYTKSSSDWHGGHFYLTVDNGYVYFHESVATNDGTSQLRVIDSHSGDVVYKGKIEAEKRDTEFEFFIMHIDFKE